MTIFLKKYKHFIILILVASSISGYLIYYGRQIKNEAPFSYVFKTFTSEDRLDKNPEARKFYVDTMTRLTFYANFSSRPSKLVSPELFLTDPLGRRTGVDPETKQFFSEIPGSSYGEDQIGDNNPLKALDVMEPMEGKYQLQIVGTASGSYSLTTRIEDQVGNIQSTTTKGVIDEEVVSTFEVNYSSTPGVPAEIKQKKIIKIFNF